MDIRVIILDFDGVIVESNNIKHRAFAELFRQFPRHYNEIMSYHYAHNAVNRYEKFRHIMGHILKREYDKELAGSWALRFSELTREAIISCPYVTGALDFIQYYAKIYPLYIASATPADELRIILEKRGLLKYLKGFFGAPTPKTVIFAEIARREMVEAEKILFIGDSREDYEAAHSFGCVFYARAGDCDFNGLNIGVFGDLAEMKLNIDKCLEREENGF